MMKVGHNESSLMFMKSHKKCAPKNSDQSEFSMTGRQLSRGDQRSGCMVSGAHAEAEV